MFLGPWGDAMPYLRFFPAAALAAIAAEFDGNGR
jgi:hypothetical protein